MILFDWTSRQVDWKDGLFLIPNRLCTELARWKLRCLAGYHQTPLHPDSQEYTAFITQYGLFEWKRVAMDLNSSGSFFQHSMANKVLAGYMWDIYRRCIDILRYGWWVSGQYSQSISAAPWKTELGLEEVEYVGHLISSTGTSFTSEEASTSLRLPSTGNWENITTVHRTSELFSWLCLSNDRDGSVSSKADWQSTRVQRSWTGQRKV